MASLKHVGRIKNTGRRCVVVFREIYDDTGKVVDENSCLVFESDSLPDAEHQDLMRIVEGEPAQTTGALYNVLSRTRLGTGVPALSWLAQSNRLRKFPTSNIELTPDSRTVLGLDQLNKIVKMQAQGSSQADIENMLRDDTDMPPRESAAVAESIVNDAENTAPVEAQTQTGDGVLDDAAIAQSYLQQAETFEQQAKELRESAIKLDPSLKPGPKKRAAPKKAPAKK